MSGFLKESSQEETLPFSLTEVGREDRKGRGSSKPLTTPYPRIPDLPRGARANATPTSYALKGRGVLEERALGSLGFELWVIQACVQGLPGGASGTEPAC